MPILSLPESRVLVPSDVQDNEKKDLSWQCRKANNKQRSVTVESFHNLQTLELTDPLLYIKDNQ